MSDLLCHTTCMRTAKRNETLAQFHYVLIAFHMLETSVCTLRKRMANSTIT